MKRSRYVVVALLAGVVLCAGTGPAYAETVRYVDDDGHADFNTIQAAIDAASDGDTIIVRDGTYSGPGNRNIDFLGKAVHLRSASGPAKCIIKADGGRVFYFHSGEGQDSILQGFTITGSTLASGDGAGILCYQSSPAILNNIIMHNSTERGNGGGIACVEGSPLLENNTIVDNRAEGIVMTRDEGLHLGGWGGGICIERGTPTIRNCIVYGNSASHEIGKQIYSGGGLVTYSLVNDPAFADMGNHDFHLRSKHGRWDGTGWVYDNMTSPAIDTGDPASDASKESDPGSCRINMGAYGNTAQASRGIDRKDKGDVNDDCAIDILDLLGIRAYLNADPVIEDARDADINRDGHVNILDLIMARNNIGMFSDE